MYFIRLWVFICTEVTIPTELSGMRHVSSLFMLILCLQLCTQFVFCTKRYFLLTGSSAAVLKVRLNRIVNSKDRFRKRKEKLSEI